MCERTPTDQPESNIPMNPNPDDNGTDNPVSAGSTSSTANTSGIKTHVHDDVSRNRTIAITRDVHDELWLRMRASHEKKTNEYVAVMEYLTAKRVMGPDGKTMTKVWRPHAGPELHREPGSYKPGKLRKLFGDWSAAVKYDRWVNWALNASELD